MPIAVCAKNDLFSAIVPNRVLSCLHGHDAIVSMGARAVEPAAT
jgi:hypothetical protein